MRVDQTNQSATVLTSAARTTTGQSNAFSVGTGANLSVLVDVTAVSGTGPSMTVKVEWSHDGTNWFAGDTADAFTAMTATGKKAKQFSVKGLYARLNYAITGTTPSFTFAAYAVTGG